jgi:hypothetical protein
MPFEIARTRVRRPDAGELDGLQTAFAAKHCVKLPRFIEPGILSRFQARLAAAPFVDRVRPDIGTDMGLADDTLLGTLLVFINDAAVFETIQAITGCDAIGSYLGNVYRLQPNSRQHYGWHDDIHGTRMLAMSVNLGTERYEGGVLQVRDAATTRVLAEMSGTEPGDALLLRIAADLEHRVTPVTGAHPRTALAGWFVRSPTVIRDGSASASPASYFVTGASGSVA